MMTGWLTVMNDDLTGWLTDWSLIEIYNGDDVSDDEIHTCIPTYLLFNSNSNTQEKLRVERFALYYQSPYFFTYLSNQIECVITTTSDQSTNK